MQELVSNFDNISVTNVSDTNYGDDNPNSAVMYTIFGKYHKLGPSMDEEDLIDEIQDATDVNWDEVSAIRKLPEFIMEEFSDQLNWVIVLFNRVMTKKIIDRFRKQLLIAPKTPKVLDNLIDTKEKAMYVMLNVNEGMFNDIFNHVCVSGYVRLIELLLKDIRVTDDMFQSRFTNACQNGRTASVEVLLKDSRLTIDAFNGQFISACQTGHAATVELLLKDSRLTEDAIESGFTFACSNNDRTIFEFLNTNSRIKKTVVNNVFVNACRDNNLRIVELLITNPRINTINIAFGIVTELLEKSCVLNQLLFIILKHPYITNDIFNQYVNRIYNIDNRYPYVKQPFDIGIYFDVLVQDQRITNETLIVCFKYAYNNNNRNLLGSMLKLNRNSIDFIVPVLEEIGTITGRLYKIMKIHSNYERDRARDVIKKINDLCCQFIKHEEVTLELIRSLRSKLSSILQYHLIDAEIKRRIDQN
jgi:hypothetical protein